MAKHNECQSFYTGHKGSLNGFMSTSLNCLFGWCKLQIKYTPGEDDSGLHAFSLPHSASPFKAG